MVYIISGCTQLYICSNQKHEIELELPEARTPSGTEH